MLRFDMSRELAITADLTATQLSNAAKSSPVISKPDSISRLLAASYAF
jgi:outer membrane scaffolding protein for murein synthesis (MipA/OmpV family)